jgi:hypothetical protein
VWAESRKLSMSHVAVIAAVALLVIVAAISARVWHAVTIPGRREVLRLQNERIERTLRDDSDMQLELEEVPN